MVNLISGRGGIGIRARLRCVWVTLVRVQVPSTASKRLQSLINSGIEAFLLFCDTRTPKCMISRGACAYIMKKIRMQKDDRIDFLWDKYILECRLQGYSETTLRNKEYYFSVFYRYLGESGRASLLTKGVCVSFLQQQLKEVSVSINFFAGFP